jgi:hypothetical protein
MATPIWKNKNMSIQDDLLALGLTSDEVADSLRQLGITGGHTSVSCPIFNYLISKGHNIMSVGRKTVKVGSMYEVLFEGLPEPVMHFILRFDGETFPELEAT